MNNEEQQFADIAERVLRGASPDAPTLEALTAMFESKPIQDHLRARLGRESITDLFNLVFAVLASPWLDGQFAGTRLSGFLASMERVYPYAFSRGFQLREERAFAAIPPDMVAAGKLLLAVAERAATGAPHSARHLEGLLAATIPDGLLDVATDIVKNIPKASPSVPAAREVLASPPAARSGTVGEVLQPLREVNEAVFEAASVFVAPGPSLIKRLRVVCERTGRELRGFLPSASLALRPVAFSQRAAFGAATGEEVEFELADDAGEALVIGRNTPEATTLTLTEAGQKLTIDVWAIDPDGQRTGTRLARLSFPSRASVTISGDEVLRRVEEAGSGGGLGFSAAAPDQPTGGTA